MAWVQQNYRLRIKLVDSGANTTTVDYEMTAADDATAATDALVVIGALEAVCAAGTVSYEIVKVFANDALTIPADSQVQIEEKALIVMRDETNPLKKHSVRIPAPETDVFLAVSGDGQNIVDIAHGDVQTFCDLFSTAGELYISDGETTQDSSAGGILYGRKVHHRSRRG